MKDNVRRQKENVCESLVIEGGGDIDSRILLVFQIEIDRLKTHVKRPCGFSGFKICGSQCHPTASMRLPEFLNKGRPQAFRYHARRRQTLSPRDGYGLQSASHKDLPFHCVSPPHFENQTSETGLTIASTEGEGDRL
jgi:hypothetical protein